MKKFMKVSVMAFVAMFAINTVADAQTKKPVAKAKAVVKAGAKAGAAAAVQEVEMTSYIGDLFSFEYPADWKPGDEPYYPLNNDRNNELYKKYEELSEADGNVIFGGRLGKYKYYDMDDTIAACMQDYKRITTT